MAARTTSTRCRRGSGTYALRKGASWRQNVDQIISSNRFSVLTHASAVSHAQMESSTNALYLAYDERRRQQEATHADQQNEAELKTLENTLKHRPRK